MDGVILLRAINASFISREISNWTNFLIYVKLRKMKIVFSTKLGDMDQADQTTSNETIFSTNMENPLMSKKEKSIARILATKFHTDPATEPEIKVRLNPITGDLIINEHVDRRYKRAVKQKRSKRQKTGVSSEVVKSVGENQLVWLNTLKEEIAKPE
jgi:hypothetical protein